MNTINSNRVQPKRRVISLILALVFVLTILAVPVCAEYPKPTDNVADSAGILSEGTIRSIHNANEVTAEEVGAIIAVCTVSTTGDTPIGEYARGVFNDWKLGESILILIAVDDMNYYFLQSTAIDTVLTNSELLEITNEYLESDFVDGNTDTGVMKVAAKLSSVLSSRLPKIEEKAPEKSEGTTVGSVIVGFFKTILIILLIAAILFVALFVIALFNDDVAAIFQKYIFKKKKTGSVPVVQYDERLYGSPRRPQNSAQSQRYGQQQNRQAPQNNRSNGGYNGYNGNNAYTGYGNYSRTLRGDEYYDANGTRR